MKKILYMAGVALAGFAMTACSPEEYEGADPNKRPQASDIDATITVNQETNQVTFNLNNKGCVPIWRLYKNGIDKAPVISTRDGYNDIITLAGEYTLEIQMYNHHGICEGVKTETITIEKSIIDWNKYMTPLTSGASKKWEMARKVKGHLACGEPGTDGTNWWSAGPMEKEGSGMYDDLVTFTYGDAGRGQYVYNPGEDGLLYVNKDCTGNPFDAFNTNDGNDFGVQLPVIESEYQLSVEGTDLFITLNPETPIIYCPLRPFWENPKFKVHSLKAAELEFTVNLEGITWHYLLVPEGTSDMEEENPAVGGAEWVAVDSPDNLMNGGALALASTWFANNDWQPVDQPDVTIDGNTALITSKADTGGSQWQGQVHFNTGVAIEEGTAYDFKIVLEPSQNIGGLTVKPHPEGDDGHFFSEGRHDVNAYEDNVITYENVVADFSTANLVITLDMAGITAGNTVAVKEIIIQTHRGETPVIWADVDSAENLFSAANFRLNNFWWANNDWQQIADPDIAIDGRNATITVKEQSGGSQWQGQAHFWSDVKMEAGKAYDFKIVLNPTCNLAGATVKPHPEGDDVHFISEGRHDLNAYEDNVVTYTNYVSEFDTDNLVITLDFPGCPAGTIIEVSGIVLQEHK